MFVFSLPIVFRNIQINPLLIRNTRLKLALAISIVVPMIIVNEEKETSLLAPNKTSKV